MTYGIFLSCIISYILGSYPTAYFIIRMFERKNIFESGDKNMGGTNGLIISKSYKIFFLIGLVDILKSFFAAVTSYYIIKDFWLAALLSGIFSTLGHNYSVFKNFKGGKGASTNAGTFFFINPSMMVLFLLSIMVLSLSNKKLNFTNNEFVESIYRMILFLTLTSLFFPDFFIHALVLQSLSVLKYATEGQFSKKILEF
ncbi:Glycerol-3-phosphate acyltransferase [Candidatus Tiddalikarchaeum anstoanum]|nr:Glycerol-3-phosphate acyltransferase [Candidatus Tiddalikarchaeum anstoanum]